MNVGREVAAAALFASCSLAPAAAAAPKAGEIVQSDNLGMNLYSYDYNAKTTKTVSDRAELSEFLGIHYFFADGWRIGANVQFTERLTPAPPAGQGYFRTFAVLPQIGWHFYDPFFAALVLTLAPFIDGQQTFVLGTQLVVGAGFTVASGVKISVALEVPWNFVGKTTIGLTPLAGVSFAF